MSRQRYWISALRVTLWNLRRGNFIPPWRRTSRVVLWGHRRFDRSPLSAGQPRLIAVTIRWEGSE